MSRFLARHPRIDAYAVRIFHCFFWAVTGIGFQLARSSGVTAEQALLTVQHLLGR